MQKQVLPILLQVTPFNSKLLKAPGTLKGLVQQYKQKSKMLDEAQNNKPKNEFFDNIALDIFLFAAAIISMLTIAEFCTAQWYAIAALTVLTILLNVYNCLSNQKCTLFKRRLFKYSNYYVVLFRCQAVCSSKIMRISRQYSFISDLWTIGFKPNNPRKELSMGHDKNRLERSLCDFEWHNNKSAKNG